MHMPSTRHTTTYTTSWSQWFRQTALWLTLAIRAPSAALSTLNNNGIGEV